MQIFLIGTGLIGSEFLKQVSEVKGGFLKETGQDLKVAGLADVDKQLVLEVGIDAGNWQSELKEKGEANDLEKFLEEMIEMDSDESKVFVDCTASQKIADLYERVLSAGISVVTPNKKAASGELAYYQKLKNLAKQNGVKYLYEVNVGAGLPVISTLNDLIKTGDEILKIEGILSGTLSYIFNTWDETQDFSEVVLQAKELGFTEPDPRDDLNGVDVARKILILARETGLEVEMEDIQIENLVPEECRVTESVEEFFEKMKGYDEDYKQKFLQAKKEGKVLRYVAKLENGKTTVELLAVDANHPFYSMKGSDNIISYTTKRYKNNPLVIKGPGAGAEVTAGGVLADVMR